MTEEEINALKLNAKDYIKKHKKALIEKFASTEKFRAYKTPVSFFMAGSAGAGKTETSQKFVLFLNKKINEIEKDDKKSYLVRIDGDEIREMLPGYNGKNSSYFQGAISQGVNKIFDHVIKKKLNFLLDGTFAKWGVSSNNIDICIRKGREIYIIYIYQDPVISWQLTKAREIKDGRVVPMQDFVDDFFSSRENVNKIKKIYGNKINLSLINKRYDNEMEKLHQNIDNIDNYFKMDYDKESLLSKLKELNL